MGLDIRIPIGLMFGIIGAILAVFGLVSDPKIYEPARGINVNLGWGWVFINVNLGWGCVLLAFAAFMLAMAYRAYRRRKQ